MDKIKLPLATGSKAIPIFFTDKNWKKTICTNLNELAFKWADKNFTGTAGSICLLPGSEGKIEAVLFGKNDNPLNAGRLAKALPKGIYQFVFSKSENKTYQHQACLGFFLGGYIFDRYTKKKQPEANLVLPKTINRSELISEVEANFIVRNLINTPTNDMGPDELEANTRAIAKKFDAKVQCIKGEQLLKKNFPMIHTVGRASDKAPRLIDLKWGRSTHKKLTLVGKGVCFDTGGLNIKPGNSMALMKKDMGGAANVLGLAYMIMAAKLPVRLRVLIPAVENNISANAFRPSDVLESRKGISVEIGNTDAEGRLILGDALTYGDEEKPDLMIDMATLTGAARVALGPDLPPFYTDDDKLALQISKAGEATNDPLWRMPLWKPYVPNLNSKVADINHISSGGFAGSITAALFLQQFVSSKTPWVHFDVYGWMPSSKPWASVGGEAQGIRALFDVLKGRYKN